MTIASQPIRHTYACSGSTGPFAFPHRFLAAADLAVTRIAADGTRTRLTLGDAYAVSGAGDADGGEVTTVAAYANGQLEVWLDMAIVQETVYTPGDAFPAAAHERALDRLTLVAGQLAGDVAALDERVDEAFDTITTLAVAMGESGGGGAGLTPYAFDAASPLISLAHQPILPGVTYPVTFFDGDRGVGGACYWRCFSLTPAGAVGARSHVPGVGLVMEGAYGRLQLLPGPGGVVDVRAAGVKCDATFLGSPSYHVSGGTTGQQGLMHALRDFAIEGGLVLSGGGAYRMEAGAGLDMKNARLAWGDLKLACDPGFSGFMLRLGGDYHLTETFESDVFLWGDNGGFISDSAAKGLQIYDDFGPLATYRAKVAYLSTGVDFFGQCEKKHATIHGEYTDFLVTITQDTAVITASIAGTNLIVTEVTGGLLKVGMAIGASGVDTNTVIQSGPSHGGPGTYVLNNAHTLSSRAMDAVGASPDSNHLLIVGHNCKHWVWCAPGTDSSFDITFNVEGRTRSDDGIAAVELPVGKNGRVGGWIRAHNGPEDLIKLSKDHGVSGLHFDNLVIEHGYATALNLEWIQRVSGQVTIRSFGNSNNGGTSNHTVVYGRIANGAGLTVTVVDGKATYPVQVGSSDGVYFPIDCDLPATVIQVGNPEPFQSSYPSGYGLRLFKGRNFRLPLLALDGNVKTEAGIIRGGIELPTTWLAAAAGTYGFTAGHVTPNLQVRFRGGCYSDDVFDRAWLFGGISVDSIIDFDGQPFAYSLGSWDPSGPVRATATLLASRTSRFNANLGGTGVQAWDATNARPMFKSAATQTAPWKDAAGGNANTVVYQTATGSFMTAIGVAGGTAPGDGTAEKDGIDIVFAGLADLGYTPVAMYWWCLGAAYADAGRAALRLNMMGSGFGLTENNFAAVNHAAGVGYVGGGALASPTPGWDFYLSGGPSVLAGDGGLSRDNVFAGWMTLTQPSTSNIPDWSSVNGKFKGKFRHDDGGSFAVSTPTSTGYSAGSGFAPAWRAAGRFGVTDTRGYANDRLDVTDTTNADPAIVPTAGAGDALEFFRQAGVGQTDRTLSFFLIGPKPTSDAQANGIARVVRRGLRKAGRGVW